VGAVTVEITRRCHRRCVFCYVDDLIDPEPESHTELATSDLTRLARTVITRTGCRQVQLSGGEPLLHPDLFEIIDSVLEIPARVSMITDLGPLTRSTARQLKQRGVGPLQPTVLSGEPELHDRLRGKGAFKDVTRALAIAAEAGLDVIVSMVITRQNHDQAEKIAELAFALGARALTLSRFCPVGPAAGASAELMPDADQVRRAASEAADACRTLGLSLSAAVTIPRCVFDDPNRPPLPVGVCSLLGPRTTVTLGPDGGVKTCSLSRTSAGNLMEESWDVIWRRIREEHLAPVRAAIPDECADCAHWSRCLGGCRLSALSMHGSLDAPDPLAPPEG
jgi:radical SAM protein with 4Fe4S-binding SPASM domain